MSTFSLTDNFNNPVTAPVNWTALSALFKYLKSEVLHLVVFPDFIQHKDQLISQIAPPAFAGAAQGGIPVSIGRREI